MANNALLQQPCVPPIEMTLQSLKVYGCRVRYITISVMEQVLRLDSLTFIVKERSTKMNELSVVKYKCSDQGCFAIKLLSHQIAIFVDKCMCQEKPVYAHFFRRTFIPKTRELAQSTIGILELVLT